MTKGVRLDALTTHPKLHPQSTADHFEVTGFSYHAQSHRSPYFDVNCHAFVVVPEQPEIIGVPEVSFQEGAEGDPEHDPAGKFDCRDDVCGHEKPRDAIPWQPEKPGFPAVPEHLNGVGAWSEIVEPEAALGWITPEMIFLDLDGAKRKFEQYFVATGIFPKP